MVSVAGMAGSNSGVASRVSAIQKRAVYMHCYGHAHNLACGDAGEFGML